MNTQSIPAEEHWPITSPVVIYWRGLDHLAAQWERTKPLGDLEGDIPALHEYLFWRKNLVVWACCALEGIVNEFGVAWLGDAFFKNNLERLDIHKKVVVLYALKYHVRLAESNDAIKEVKELFAFRNRLVHPKTKSYQKDRALKDNLRAKLDCVTPDDLRKAIRRVSGLFEPDPQGANMAGFG